MNARRTTITRTTNETSIDLSVNLDGNGSATIETPIGFLNHMLTLFTFQSRMDLTLKVTGDTNIDEHHTIEDVGIALGTAIAQSLGDKRGITRYGFFILPMDESLATAALDLSGRYAFTFDCPFTRERVGDFPTELFYDFWDAVAQNARMNIAIKVENGRNDHHKAEAVFKAMGRAMRIAMTRDVALDGDIPSTKGTL
jgi:imidazoleglycerol phosphate dehydratase HisB